MHHENEEEAALNSFTAVCSLLRNALKRIDPLCVS
jgi:hypothetical protein